MSKASFGTWNLQSLVLIFLRMPSLSTLANVSADPTPEYRIYSVNQDRFPLLTVKLRDIALESWIAPWDTLPSETTLLMIRLRRKSNIAGQWAAKFAIMATSGFLYEFTVLEDRLKLVPGYNTVREEFAVTPTESWDLL